MSVTSKYHGAMEYTIKATIRAIGHVYSKPAENF